MQNKNKKRKILILVGVILIICAVISFIVSLSLSSDYLLPPAVYAILMEGSIISLFIGMIMIAVQIYGILMDKAKKNIPTYCVNCGKISKIGSEYCQHCGKSLKKVCPHCGKNIDVKTKFCPHCGKPTE